MPLPYKIATLLYCFNRRDQALLLLRTQDPNRGLWSPCGGKLHVDDGESPHACACREAEEEIGLARAEVSVRGELPPVSTFVTGYLIHPFVGLIPAGRRWRASPSEVDAVLELPLGALREGRTRTRMERRGVSFETDAYIVGENLIWGATARILDDLFERLSSIGIPLREQ